MDFTPTPLPVVSRQCWPYDTVNSYVSRLPMVSSISDRACTRGYISRPESDSILLVPSSSVSAVRGSSSMVNHRGQIGSLHPPRCQTHKPQHAALRFKA